jgi:hypothetical protein
MLLGRSPWVLFLDVLRYKLVGWLFMLLVQLTVDSHGLLLVYKGAC